MTVFFSFSPPIGKPFLQATNFCRFKNNSFAPKKKRPQQKMLPTCLSFIDGIGIRGWKGPLEIIRSSPLRTLAVYIIHILLHMKSNVQNPMSEVKERSCSNICPTIDCHSRRLVQSFQTTPSIIATEGPRRNDSDRSSRVTLAQDRSPKEMKSCAKFTRLRPTKEVIFDVLGMNPNELTPKCWLGNERRSRSGFGFSSELTQKFQGYQRGGNFGCLLSPQI